MNSRHRRDGTDGRSNKNRIPFQSVIKVIQGNIDRGRAAMDLIYKMAEENNADIIIMAEPNKKKVAESAWITDKRTDVAILIRNNNLKILHKVDGNGYVCVETQTVVVYGCYISPNVDMIRFTTFLRELRNDMKKHDKEIVVGGDFNAKSYHWGSSFEDRRGEFLVEWLAEEDLAIHNQGTVPTFKRGISESYIDITFSTKGIADHIRNWRVLEEENLSFHQHITFEIAIRTNKPCLNGAQWKRGWRVKKERLSAMTEVFGRSIQAENDAINAKELTKYITAACDKTFSKKSNNNRKPVFWWSEEIAEKRSACLKSKRALTRANKRNDEDMKARHHVIYTLARSDLKKAIKIAKKNAWKKLIQEVDEDIWGKAYQIVVNKFRTRRPICMTDEQQLEIAHTLFPVHPITVWTKFEVREDEIPLLSMEELEKAVQKLRERKAPGPDGIPAEVLKAIVMKYKIDCLKIFNRIMVSGKFPEEWKTARLVIIEKEKKSLQQDKAYRPICILNTLAKLLEQLLLARLKSEIHTHGGLANNQHGFREGRSTITALSSVKQIADAAFQGPYSSRRLCALITVDVQNAFNSAPWDGILRELRRRDIAPYLYNIMASYFEGRILLVGEGEKMNVTCGVPQGSVLGPTLWNIYYDGILGIAVPKGVSLIGYADDLGVIVEAKKPESLEVIAEHALHNVTEWIYSKKLKLAPQKTEAVLLIGGRKTKSITIRSEETLIHSQESVRYLGVHLDRNMRMGIHILKTAEKACKALTAISRIMPNVGGPREGSRRILCSVVQSIMLYGASVWVKAMEKEVHRRVFTSVQRRTAIKLICAYRTVSSKALLVLSRTPPIELLAKERASLEIRGKNVKNETHAELMTAWQEVWQREDNTAVWTKRLIKDIAPWVDREHGDLDFYLTQVLTGHGCFQAYLYKFKISDTEDCLYCHRRDTAEHTFFECARWEEIRTRTEESIGKLTPENIVCKMLSSEESWKKVSKLARDMLETKNKESKERQTNT